MQEIVISLVATVACISGMAATRINTLSRSDSRYGSKRNDPAHPIIFNYEAIGIKVKSG